MFASLVAIATSPIISPHAGFVSIDLEEERGREERGMAMNPKATLYEMLGVQNGAGLAELQSAYRRELSSLEAMRGSMSSQEFNDKAQLLRVIMNTLTDPVSRLSYDAKLAAASRTATSSITTRSLATRSADTAVGPQVRADALSLRADALALRADAMLVRAGLDDPGSHGASTAQVVASAALTGLKRFTRALGLLVLVCIVAFGVTRLITGDSSVRRAAAEAKVNAQTALQEYYQTHGVRPANMAELELLEAERRRRENQARQVDQNREKQERDARRFEEESRQRGREVSEQLRMAEEEVRRNAERDAWQEQMKKQDQRLREEAEQRRIERERQQWRETLRR
jgi:curved DNA-binding protein CbpA